MQNPATAPEPREFGHRSKPYFLRMAKNPLCENKAWCPFASLHLYPTYTPFPAAIGSGSYPSWPLRVWIPASAGMTKKNTDDGNDQKSRPARPQSL